MTERKQILDDNRHIPVGRIITQWRKPLRQRRCRLIAALPRPDLRFAVKAIELERQATAIPFCLKISATLRGSVKKIFDAVRIDSLRNPLISTPSYPYSFARAAMVWKSQVGVQSVLNANFIEGVR